MISNGRDAKRFKYKGRNGIMKIKFLLKFSQPISEYFFFLIKISEYIGIFSKYRNIRMLFVFVQILIREKDSLGNFLELEPIIQVLTVFTADFNLSQASIHLKFLEEKYFVLSIVKILMKEREKCDKL